MLYRRVNLLLVVFEKCSLGKPPTNAHGDNEFMERLSETTFSKVEGAPIEEKPITCLGLIFWSINWLKVTPSFNSNITLVLSLFITLLFLKRSAIKPSNRGYDFGNRIPCPIMILFPSIVEMYTLTLLLR